MGQDSAKVKQLVGEIQRLQLESVNSKRQTAQRLQELEEGTAKLQALDPAHKKLEEEAAKARQLSVKVQKLEKEAVRARELSVKVRQLECHPPVQHFVMGEHYGSHAALS